MSVVDLNSSISQSFKSQHDGAAHRCAAPSLDGVIKGMRRAREYRP